MAHGTLLGVAIAGALSLPLWLGVAGTAVLLVGVLWALHDNRLPNDALLALCSATLLCSGLLFIQHVPSLRPELLSYLFGDLLSIDWPDLPVFTLIIAISLVILYRFGSHKYSLQLIQISQLVKGECKLATPYFYAVISFIYSFSFACCRFFANGCITSNTSFKRSSIGKLTKANGYLGIRVSPAWC